MVSGPVQIAGYELLRQLGVGGMSTVWLALQQSGLPFREYSGQVTVEPA